MTDVEYAELHTPLFLAGTNLGQKLDPTKRRGLSLVFDDDKRRLIVGWGNKTAMIPEANVASFVPGKIEDPVKKAPEDGATTARNIIRAQVSTPQDHVFAGAGHGKSR